VTPEGSVKAKVKKVLTKYGDELDAFWPVQNGMGSPALDCIICYLGHHIEVETKAPGKALTPRQIITAEKKVRAGANVFVIDGNIGCAKLDAHLRFLKQTTLLKINPDRPHGFTDEN